MLNDSLKQAYVVIHNVANSVFISLLIGAL